LVFNSFSLVGSPTVLLSDRRDPQSQSIGISNEEKAIIRSKLLTHVDEKNVTIVNQIAVLVAQIARLDWPRFWYINT